MFILNHIERRQTNAIHLAQTLQNCCEETGPGRVRGKLLKRNDSFYTELDVGED